MYALSCSQYNTTKEFYSEEQPNQVLPVKNW